MTRSIRIGSDSLEVEFLPELGARIHRLRAFGHDLLRTPEDRDAYLREPFSWGAFVMAPWCNRVGSGATPVGEATVRLSPNFADGTAIHGQVHAVPWDVIADDTLRVTGGGDGWPWRYQVELRVHLDEQTLRLAHTLTNVSHASMPAGIGLHPWFRRPLEVAIPATRVHRSNASSDPEPAPVDGPTDLRHPRPMPADLDATWILTDASPTELRWPSLGIAATLRTVPPARYLCAASPAGIDAVAIEPQTHAPNGLRRLVRDEPGGLRLLEPGDALQLEVEMAFGR